MNWRPLSLRGKADARFDGPSEGLPAWLRDPVLNWARDSFHEVGYPHDSINLRALQDLQLELRLEAPLSRGNQLVDLLTRMSQDQEFALDVLDWMLQHWRRFTEGLSPHQWAQALNETLRQGGSGWEVTTGNDHYQLTRRAVGPVVEVLEHTATEATRAHNHLASAWSKLTGRNPDPSGAYREAVRAVEAVAKPIVLPDSDKATLGQMIPAMRDKPEKWTTAIGSVDDVRAQMEAAWTSQLDRHGTDDETVPLSVSPEQADAAFSTCLNLVRLFVGGHVTRAE